MKKFLLMLLLVAFVITYQSSGSMSAKYDTNTKKVEVKEYQTNQYGTVVTAILENGKKLVLPMWRIYSIEEQ